MFSILIAISAVAIAATSNLSKSVCHHYSNSPPSKISYKRNPCYGAERDSNGVCNLTHACDYANEDKQDISCFAAWTNTSGNVTLMVKGCWDGSNPDKSNSRCIDTTKPKTKEKNAFFCFCNGYLCNSEFSFEPPIPEKGSSILVDTDAFSTLRNRIALSVLVPVVVIILVMCLYLYQHYFRKSQPSIADSNLENLACGPPSPTAMTNLLSSGQSEFNFPQMIEIKARGRFGCVWKAQLQDRCVAVKVFSLQNKASWLNEQEILNIERIQNHSNILHFIAATSRGVGVETELWLITEFHELGSLADFMKTETFSLAEALKFSESMAVGLSFLHEDIIYGQNPSDWKPAIAHRDFKSKNVLIRSDMSAVIADFGLAMKFVPGENVGETHGQVGTRRYMAPEVLEGAINFQRDSFLCIDLYAFALVLWEILTRCRDLPGGASATYLMPYEAELGQHVSLEQMQVTVVDGRLRPMIKDEWKQHEVFGIVCETIEECWDHDAEARLSAGCVEERITKLRKQPVFAQTGISLHSNLLDSDLITNNSPLLSSALNAEIQAPYVIIN